MLVNNWYTSRKLIDTYSQKEFHLILIGGLQANSPSAWSVLKLLNSILTNIQKLQSTHLPRLFMTIKYILAIRKMPRSCCLRNTNSIQGILSHAYQVNLNTHLLYNEKRYPFSKIIDKEAFWGCFIIRAIATLCSRIVP